jgi:hypothetical protein
VPGSERAGRKTNNPHKQKNFAKNKHMKRSIIAILGASLLALGPALSLQAQNPPAGQVDFGKFVPPSSGADFVEVNLTTSLISLASQLVEKEDAEVAHLLKTLTQVRVTAIGIDDENRADLKKRAQKVREELDSKGWERIVTAQKDEQTVGVFLKSRNKDTVEGIVVLATEGNKRAVFVNIVGDIKPEQIAKLGEKLHIDPLKKVGEATQN